MLNTPAGAQSIISFPLNKCSVTEGIGLLAVPISRQNEIDKVASVNVTSVDSTAKSGIHYAGTNATLTFQVGETQRVIYIPILMDYTTDKSKAFSLLLSGPTEGATLGSSTNLGVTINNDSKGLHFYVPAVSINEDAGQVVIKVARGDSSDNQVSVDYGTIDGEAKAGQDYTSVAGTLSFGPGEVIKSFAVPVLNDTLPEPSKSFKVVLSNPTGGAVLAPPNGMPTVMTVTIKDTDQIVQFEFPYSRSFEQTVQPQYYVGEESLFANVGVTRGESDSAATVDVVASSATAVTGRDFNGVTNTIQFGAGERRKLIQVPLLNNQSKDPARYFQLKLINPTGGAILGTNIMANVNIVDDDRGVGFSANHYPALYGQAVATVPVMRGGGEEQRPFTVDFRTAELKSVGGAAELAAKAGVDFQSITGRLRFESNEEIKSIAIPLLVNQAASSNKSFNLILSNPSDGAVVKGSGVTTVEIFHQLKGSWPVIPPIAEKLNLALQDGVRTLKWDNNHLLRHADQVNGPWENLPNASSPYATRAAFAAGFYQIQSTRSATIYVPSSYDGRTPMPLIMALHPATGTAAGFLSDVNLLPQGEEKGCLICYPEGVSTIVEGGYTWNGPDFLPHIGADVDDSGYLRSLIEEICRQYVVDPKRIYSIGHSAGGAMSHRLAYDHADLIAGIVSLAGATSYDPKDCHPSQHVNMLEIHGSSDTTVLYYGGYLPGPNPKASEAPGAVRTTQIWAKLNGSRDPVVDAAPSVKAITGATRPDTTVLRYGQCPPGGAVELWTINGGDHVAPATVNLSLVVDWLLAHPKP